MIKDILDKQIVLLDLKFKFFVTIPYGFKNTDISRVRRDNQKIKECLRKFYDYPVRIFFFIEQHTDPASKHFQGYHRHLLVEDLPPEKWKKVSISVERDLLNNDATALFAVRMNGEVTDKQKAGVLKRFLHRCPSVPGGSVAVDVRPITDTSGLLEYCTKQSDKELSTADVFDEDNSDINTDQYWRDWDDASSKSLRRYQGLLK